MSKILDDTGEGNTAVVLAALDVIQEYFLSRKRPAVLSMSLGGDCDGGRTALACMHDPIVLAVERLSALGMVASVAAGNDRASACHGSPNSASSAVNVGATNIDDETAYFSNIGEYIAFLITKYFSVDHIPYYIFLYLIHLSGDCIDVLAPGENVVSAVARIISGREDAYRTMSGTSMAAPHVSGVLALHLQRNSSLTPRQVVAQLLCEAVPLILIMDPLDTRSRNLLLQAPRSDPSLSLDECWAHLGGSCSSLCSQEGVCMPSRYLALTPFTSSSSSAVEDNDRCYCNGGHYGQDCSSITPFDPSCSKLNDHRVIITLLDGYGDGTMPFTMLHMYMYPIHSLFMLYFHMLVSCRVEFCILCYCGWRG